MTPNLDVDARHNEPTRHPEGGLLLQRLEEAILSGQGSRKIARTIERPQLWRRLSPEDRLRWAELAQMVGNIDTALTVLESVHQDAPDHQPAWDRHLELLAILGRQKDLAALTARAKPHMGSLQSKDWLSTERGPVVGETDVEASLAPFRQRAQRMASLKQYLSLFAGRQDCFARQWVDRGAGRQGYVPVRHQLRPADLEDHLRGLKTYGIYLLQKDGRIRTAALDADLNKSFRGGQLSQNQKRLVRREAAYLVSRVTTLCIEANCPPLVEYSGVKGYHFWFFFPTATDPAPVRRALGKLVEQVSSDLSAFSLEVFPKQDHLDSKGLGNLIKLPLGVHRLSGKRSYFPGCRDRSLEAQLDFLTTAVYSKPKNLLNHFTAPLADVVVHPKAGTMIEMASGAESQLAVLAKRCPPLRAVLKSCCQKQALSLREEKIIYQSVGFLPEGRQLLHFLLAKHPEYNPHQLDYRLSRLRGTPLGCRRIHNLTGYQGPFCRFRHKDKYAHPLLHLVGWQPPVEPVAEKRINLKTAIEDLRTAIFEVERLLP